MDKRLLRLSVLEGLVFYFAVPALTEFLQSVFGKIYAAGLIADPDGWYTNFGFAFKFLPAVNLFDKWVGVDIIFFLNLLFWVAYFVVFNFLWVRVLWFLNSRGWIKVGR